MTEKNYFKPLNQLTFETVTENRQQFVQLLEADDLSSIHCDLSDVDKCDSAGLAFLVEARRLCRAQRTILIIEYIPGEIRALAKLYGVEQILQAGDDCI
ncbi:MAG: STAS domain-containing protein [Gammaproteobacteria bacterium]|nr:STAS domain-containing protein [Gammaproteobacteria bacterium]